MKVNPIQFNFIQSKPQSTANTHLRLNNQLQCDTVSFTGCEETSEEKMKKLVPKHKGIIYKKITDKKGNVTKKIPVEVNIIKDSPEVFLFEKDGDIIGNVELCYIPKEYCGENALSPLCRDYKKEGVSGARIKVEFVENENEEQYGGIAHLADLIEVAVCKKLRIKPNIVSYSFDDAAPLHYLRGKRFIPFEKYNKKLYEIHGNREPNEVVKEIIEKTPKGEKYDTSDIKDMFITYMPKEMIKELEKELEEHPIF